MTNIDRRSFLGLAGTSLLSLALGACGQAQTSPDDAAGATTTGDDGDSSSLKPGYITSSGTLATPYDEGYSSGKHHATIVVKNFGTIKVELDADAAPITVSNFAHLVNQGFYDGLTFHRIVKGFMVQGGDPLGTGQGGTSVNVLGEFAANGKENPIKHERGVISMARSSSHNSGSSQFFIVHADTESLDGQYAAFGHVTDGIEVVDALAEVPVEDDNGTVAPENQPVIESIVMDD